MYETYGKQADFYWVYIREAHPTDSARPARHVEIEQPKTYLRRQEVAITCSVNLNLTIPMLVDDLNDTISRTFDAMPDRLYIIRDGKIAYKGGHGPRGFDVAELESALVRMLPKQR
ncbi:MAG: deiodinase [Planctomycetaceae bacterium]|nr:deiodinase [Planctomycetaceae bacterium]